MQKRSCWTQRHRIRRQYGIMHAFRDDGHSLRPVLAISPLGALARSSVRYETPCVKLPGHGTREHKLRKEKIRQYVVRACVAAEKSAGRTESNSFPLQRQTLHLGSDTCRFDHVLSQCPQHTHAEIEEKSEREAERERNWLVSVSVS